MFKDLCDALELSNASEVAKRLDKDLITTYPLETSGGIQKTNFINEDGLYDVILDSRKPEARKFRKWITSEVLPSIRKYGGYIVTKQDDTDADILSRALIVANETIKQKDNLILMQDIKLENRNLKIHNLEQGLEIIKLLANQLTS